MLIAGLTYPMICPLLPAPSLEIYVALSTSTSLLKVVFSNWRDGLSKFSKALGRSNTSILLLSTIFYGDSFSRIFGTDAKPVLANRLLGLY